MNATGYAKAKIHLLHNVLGSSIVNVDILYIIYIYKFFN
jgi:hypothetical protein